MTTERLARLSTYARRGYREVEGWLGADTITRVLRIAAVQDEQGVRGNVGEIGVHHGKLFILLALLARADERAIAVDLFEDQELNVDHSGHGNRAVFEANLLRHTGSLDGVVIIKGNSTTLAGNDLTAAAGGLFRLFSIDGGHLAHIVRHDLRTARDSICEGGVVLLDDFFNPEFPGVSEGIAAFFSSGECKEMVPFLIAGNKLYVTTRSHAELYMDPFARADVGSPLADLARFQFLEGRSSPVVVTELFGRTVLVYSPDRYSARHRLLRTLRRGKRQLRTTLGGALNTCLPRDSRLGRALRRVANVVLPY